MTTWNTWITFAPQPWNPKNHLVSWRSHISTSILEKWDESFHCKLTLGKYFLSRERLMQSQPLFWGFMRFQLMPTTDSSKFSGSLLVLNSQQGQKFSLASQLMCKRQGWLCPHGCDIGRCAQLYLDEDENGIPLGHCEGTRLFMTFDLTVLLNVIAHFGANWAKAGQKLNTSRPCSETNPTFPHKGGLKGRSNIKMWILTKENYLYCHLSSSCECGNLCLSFLGLQHTSGHGLTGIMDMCRLEVIPSRSLGFTACSFLLLVIPSKRSNPLGREREKKSWL